MMMLMPNDLKPLELEIATKLIKERYVCPIYLGLTRLLIPSVGMKILIYDSDPDFIEYAKPKSKVKVRCICPVCTFTSELTPSFRRYQFGTVIPIL